MENRTFLIDNENFSSFEERLYGYTVSDTGDILVDELPERPGDTGLFVMVTKEDGDLVIRQDFCGSFGLFLWEENGRFRISNSFFRLVESLEGNYHLDQEAIRAFISSEEVPLLYSRTMVKEIRKLDSADVVRINLRTGYLRIEKKEYSYYKRRLSTKEDFEALDSWYFKWVHIIRRLAEKGVPLIEDLSGGMDTRLILSMMFNASIDINTCLRLQTHTKGNLKKDWEDLRIAKIIAGTYGLNLNSDDALKEVESDFEKPLTADLAYRSCLHTSFGSSNLVKYAEKEYDRPVFYLTGIGSTTKGGFDSSVGSVVLDETINAVKFFDWQDKGITRPWHAIIHGFQYNRWFRDQAKRILTGYDHEASHKATFLYKKCQIENRDAIKALDWINCNLFSISPFFDSSIFQFDYNPHNSDILWLNTVMLDRYAPELLKFDVQGRHFKEKTKKEARDLNRRFPVKMPEYSPLKGEPVSVKTQILPAEELSKYMEDKWSDPDFQSICLKHVSKKTLDWIFAKVDSKKMNVKGKSINSLMAVYELEKNQN